jgi:transmembrane sensor
LYKLQNGGKVDVQIINLFQKYINDQCDKQELEEVFGILNGGKHQAEWEQVIGEEADRVLSSGLQSELSQNEVDAIYDGIAAQLPSGKRKSHKLWPSLATVAAAVALVVSGIYFLNYNKAAVGDRTSLISRDIGPGNVGATLTLANGKKIKLSDAVNGVIAKETGISVTKTADGELEYVVEKTAGHSNSLNTLSTAKGETYILTLPDKSKVWLNAASSLTYTTGLSESVRRVKLQGEAYFEVTKDKTHPFLVETDNQEVEVLGTHFNISSYSDENSVKTTLLEGSVLIKPERSEERILKPGQQAILQGDAIKVVKADVVEAMAWKEGFFRFNDESIENIMLKISRWYDVDISYQGKDIKERFTGKVSRSKNISEVLLILEKTKDVHFKIEGRRVFVMQ